MRYYSFDELKEIALKDNITGNKVVIGIWAKMNGFIKIKKQIDKQRKILYYKNS